MSRLERHVNVVRTKLFLDTLVSAVAWAVMGFAAVFLVMVLVDRLLLWRLPRWDVWFLAGLGLTLAAALGGRRTAGRRPGRRPSRSTSGSG
jgi:hypothetical protein